MKKLVVLLGLALALSLVSATGAFANFGPHGGYAVNTDACAACHRAHSSFSEIQYTPKDVGALDPVDYPYALLVGSAGTMTEFCNACHGTAAPGASTNVVDGIFDSGPSGAAGQAIGADTGGGVLSQYVTDSTFGEGLNGGGFTTTFRRDFDGTAVGAVAAVTSTHMLSDPGAGALLPNWGFGSAVAGTSLTCADCHDPHGSTNYRLLKDSVNGQDVALNVFGDDDPVNYPYADGWKRGADGGAAQMAAYVPDYTGGTKLVANAGAQVGSLSEWCAACHTTYADRSSDASYEWAGSGAPINSPAYDDPAGVAPVTRHRHPVDVAPSSGDAILQVEAYQSTDADWVAGRASIPLERMIGGVEERDNNLGCLTCHFAHGSSQVMTGWASAALGTTNFNMPVRNDALGGVDPTFSSALLRADNRTVCEVCHEK
ncbi:MAG: cytochrome c3 family protein [Coriobacteriia bacterium]|nr:cytochrome c3 family protein [Coriobacteriia bacterium]